MRRLPPGWTARQSLPVLLGIIAAILIVMAGIFILDWFLARWLPLAAWTGICMITFVATVLWKSARDLRKGKSR